MDAQIIQAMVYLCEGVALSNAENTEEEKDALPRLFIAFQSFLVKVLEKCKKIMATINTVEMQAKVNNSPEMMHLVMKSRDNYQEASQINNNCIAALSNLIASNFRIGIKQCLSRAYDEDLKNRATFIKVLVHVMQIGIGKSLAGEEEDIVVAKSKYDDLVNLVTEDNLEIILAIVHHGPLQSIMDVSTSLLHIFSLRGKKHCLVQKVAQSEISQVRFYLPRLTLLQIFFEETVLHHSYLVYMPRPNLERTFIRPSPLSSLI